MRRETNSVTIFSGGLDSTALVYSMLDDGDIPHLLSFDYGQRHKKELVFARATASRLNLPHDVIDLTGITHLISNSALTSIPLQRGQIDNTPERAIEVPEGHYAEETMKATVVPNRNMIMLAIAAGVAVNEKATKIGIGVHAGDHFVYPDCRPGFISMVNKAIWSGNEGFHGFTDPSGVAIHAPFLHLSKADIAYQALLLDVPLHATWSCYKGDVKHCGKCGTCVERLEAIDEAIQRWSLRSDTREAPTDLTSYEDSTFWKTAVKA